MKAGLRQRQRIEKRVTNSRNEVEKIRGNWRDLASFLNHGVRIRARVRKDPLSISPQFTLKIEGKRSNFYVIQGSDQDFYNAYFG